MEFEIILQFFLPLVSTLITPIFILGQIAVLILVGLIQKKKESQLNKGSSPKISVIVPVYNEASSIKKTIKSLLALNYSNKEIIVVDDNSTDGTHTIAKKFFDKKQIKLLRRKQASDSRTAALNYGFTYATGDLIVMIYGDTTLDKNALKNAIKYFHNDDVFALSTNVRIISGDDGKNNFITKLQHMEIALSVDLGKRTSSISNGIISLSRECIFLRSSCFQNIGKLDVDTITEEQDLTFKIISLGGIVTYAPDVMVDTYLPNTIEALEREKTRAAVMQIENLQKFQYVIRNSRFDLRTRISFFHFYF